MTTENGWKHVAADKRIRTKSIYIVTSCTNLMHMLGQCDIMFADTLNWPSEQFNFSSMCVFVYTIAYVCVSGVRSR